MLKRIHSITVAVLCLMLVSSFANAQRYGQTVEVSINGGYSTFGMSSLKDFQEDILSQMPVQGKVTSSFPGYLNYSFEVVFFDSTYFVGIMIGHTSTGGRIQYTDYSGSITHDQFVKMNYSGFVAAKRIITTKYGNVFLGSNVLAYKNKVDFKSNEIVLNQETTSTSQFESLNIALGAFFEIQKRIKKMILKGNLGYEFHLATPLYFNDPENTIMTSSNEEVKVDASGLRFSLGVGYAIYTRTKK